MKNIAPFLFAAFLMACSSQKDESPVVEKTTSEKQLKTASTSDIVPDTVYIKETVPCKELKILYVNTDKLWEEFKMVKDYEQMMQKEKENIENQYNNQLTTLENEYKELEKIANTLSQEEIKSKQQEMLQKQQNLIALEQELTEKYNRFEAEKTAEIQKFVNNFLKTYAAKKNCDYILNYGTLSPVLYAPKEYDITAEVIHELNKKYALKK